MAMSSWFTWRASKEGGREGEREGRRDGGREVREKGDNFGKPLLAAYPRIEREFFSGAREEKKNNLDIAIEEAVAREDLSSDLTMKAFSAKKTEIDSNSFDSMEPSPEIAVQRAEEAAVAAANARLNVKKIAASFESGEFDSRSDPSFKFDTYGSTYDSAYDAKFDSAYDSKTETIFEEKFDSSTYDYNDNKNTNYGSKWTSGSGGSSDFIKEQPSSAEINEDLGYNDPVKYENSTFMDSKKTPIKEVVSVSSPGQISLDVMEPLAVPEHASQSQSPAVAHTVPESSTDNGTVQAPIYPPVHANGPPVARRGGGGEGEGGEERGEGVAESRTVIITTHADSDDPLLEPLLPGARIEFTRWKKFLGWGEQMAGESVLDDVRLACLDIFRGLAIAGMILVANSGSTFPKFLNYSAWDGLTLADFVDPFFLFAVGVAVALSFKRVPSKRQALSKIIARSTKIFVVGLFIQGGYFHGPTSLSFGVDLQDLRISGILQRIAVAFFVVSLCEVAVMKRYRDTPPQGFLSLLFRFVLHWGVAIILLLVYLFLAYQLYVPDWSFVPPSAALQLGPFVRFSQSLSTNETLSVQCNRKGDLSPACNAAGYIDRTVLGINHLSRHPSYQYSEACSLYAPAAGPPPQHAPAYCQAPFDSHGIMSIIGATLTVFAGLHFGHVLTHFRSHWVRMFHASLFSLSFVVIGYLLQFPLKDELEDLFDDFPTWLIFDYNGMPFNSSLYSASYMFFTAGIAGLVLCGLYILTDVLKVRFYTKLFEWMGRNPLLVFVLGACGVLEALLRGFYWGSADQNLVSFLQVYLQGYVANVNYFNLLDSGLKIVGWGFAAGFLAHMGHSWKF